MNKALLAGIRTSCCIYPMKREDREARLQREK
jgi:hypothetical protein